MSVSNVDKNCFDKKERKMNNMLFYKFQEKNVVERLVFLKNVIYENLFNTFSIKSFSILLFFTFSKF